MFLLYLFCQGNPFHYLLFCIFKFFQFFSPFYIFFLNYYNIFDALAPTSAGLIIEKLFLTAILRTWIDRLLVFLWTFTWLHLHPLIKTYFLSSRISKRFIFRQFVHIVYLWCWLFYGHSGCSQLWLFSHEGVHVASQWRI